jgi:hypothetical protein
MMPTDTMTILRSVVALVDVGTLGAGTTLEAVAEDARGILAGVTRPTGGSVTVLTDYEASWLVERLGDITVDTSNDHTAEMAATIQGKVTDGRAVDAESQQAVLRALLEGGVTQAAVLGVLHERGTGKDGVTAVQAKLKAIELHCRPNDDDIEVDDRPLFSASDDGLWVSAWVHLSDADLGVGKPLPDEMKGKLWLVDLGQDNAPPDAFVVCEAGRASVSPLETATAAVDKHDELLDGIEFIVLADTKEEAARIAHQKSSTSIGLVEDLWWSDPDAPVYGFSYLRRVKAD